MHFVDLGKRFEPFRTGKRPSNILWFAYLLTEPPPSRRNSLHVRMIAADVVLVNDGFSRHAEAKDVVLEWRDMHTMHVEIGRVDVAVRVLGPGRAEGAPADGGGQHDGWGGDIVAPAVGGEGVDAQGRRAERGQQARGRHDKVYF